MRTPTTIKPKNLTIEQDTPAVKSP